MNNAISIVMSVIIFFVFAFYISLFIRGVFVLWKAHQESVNIDIGRLTIKCISTLIYSLSMLSFGIMYYIGMPLDTMTYILIIFTFIVTLISGLFGEIFLSGKDLKELTTYLKTNRKL